MITNFCRIWGVFLAFLICCSCEQRGDLAPVEELRFRELNSHAQKHVVQQGETLYAIAFRYDQDYRQLALYNHLQSPYTVRVGQVLYLKPQSPARSMARLPQYRPAKVVKRIVATQKKEPLFTTPPRQKTSGWLWPIRGRVTSGYVPNAGQKGIDIAGHKGDKVQASASGVVAYAGNGLSGYGNLIIIKHDNQYLTAYGHNARLLVREGQQIHAGQPIAEIGVMDRHYWGVHFEIRRSGKPVNPIKYLLKG